MFKLYDNGNLSASGDGGRNWGPWDTGVSSIAFGPAGTSFGGVMFILQENGTLLDNGGDGWMPWENGVAAFVVVPTTGTAYALAAGGQVTASSGVGTAWESLPDPDSTAQTVSISVGSDGLIQAVESDRSVWQYNPSSGWAFVATNTPTPTPTPAPTPTPTPTPTPSPTPTPTPIPTPTPTPTPVPSPTPTPTPTPSPTPTPTPMPTPTSTPTPGPSPTSAPSPTSNPTPTATPTQTPTPTPTRLTIVGEKVFTKGRGRHSRIVGFQLEFSTALNPSSAQDAADFAVVQTVKRARKLIARPVEVQTVYDPSSNTVSLILLGNANFSEGGQSQWSMPRPPSGITDSLGNPLTTAKPSLLSCPGLLLQSAILAGPNRHPVVSYGRVRKDPLLLGSGRRGRGNWRLLQGLLRRVSEQ